MKLKGVDGLATEYVRDEVNRGAKFVFYNYCVSLGVVTFKRSSDLYFIRPGQGRLVQGLPFTLISLVAGWWGIPWGPIYTIESLVRNFGGGTDATVAVMQQLAPDQPLPGAGSEKAPVSTSPSFTQAQLVRGVGLLAALVVTLYAVVCYFMGESMPVAVINGLPEPYTVQLAGKDVLLPPRQVVRLKLPARSTRLSGVPGMDLTTLELNWPFWSRPFDSRVAVITPDRAAVFYGYDVIYYPSSIPEAQRTTQPAYTVYANEFVHVLPAPDFFFEIAPQSLQLSSQGSAQRKPRLALLESPDPESSVQAISENLGPAAAVTYATRLANLRPNDEVVLELAARVQKPEEAIAFLERRLVERPVLIHWHRLYQSLCERQGSSDALRARYAALAAATPTEGALQYLLGRITPDPVEAKRLYHAALTAKKPCVFARLGLGYLAFSSGDFEGAFAEYTAAQSAGMTGESIRHARTETLLALRRYDALLADIRERRQSRPTDIYLAASEIELSLRAGGNRTAAVSMANAFCERMKAHASAEELAETRAFLDASVAYGLGDQHEFATRLRLIKGGPRLKFQAAVSERDPEAALAALKEAEDNSCYARALVYITAASARGRDAAEAYWPALRAAISAEAGRYRQIDDHLSGKKVLTPDEICTLSIETEAKGIVLTALGLHDPANRTSYFSRAARFNCGLGFPHLLLESVLAGSAEPAARTSQPAGT